MGFWSRLRESEVEHTLRARAPQPSDELVHGIARLVARKRRHTHGRALPKVAVIAAVTSALAASLGVAGALGYAGKSMNAFGSNVVNLVVPNHHDGHGGDSNGPGQGGSNTGDHGSKGGDHQGGNGGNNGGGNSNGNGGNGGNGNGGNGNGNPGDGNGGQGDDGDGDHDPFGHQYGHRIPICWQGHIIHVTLPELVWYFLHGAGPPWQCSNGHGHGHDH